MKKRILEIFAAFLAAMLAFTFLSRAADSVTVARVQTSKASQGRITHTVQGTGRVEQNRERAVSVLSGQTVKTIYVGEGQKVGAGDVLFEVDLDSLKEQILEKQQEMKKAQLESQDKASSREAEAWKEAVTQNRAAQDYSVAATKADTAVSRAAAELSAARKKLKTLEQSTEDPSVGTDAVEAVLKEACEQKQKEYEEAVQYRDQLEKAIDEAVKQAVEDAKKGGETAGLTAVQRETHMAAQTAESGEAADAQEELPTAAQAEEDPKEDPADAAVPEETAGITVQPETGSDPATETEEIQPAQQEPISEAEYVIDGAADGQTEGETEDAWLVEQRVRKQNQALLDGAEQEITQKEQELKEAKEALTVYQQEKASGTQTSAEEMKEQLQKEIREKQEAYEDAVSQAGDSLRSASRAVEDAGAPTGTDSTGEIDAITRQQEELELEKLEQLLAQEGKVTAPVDAVVTKINLTTGEKTPEGTAMLLTDTEAGNRLVAQVDAEQERYIGKGDAVNVKTNSSNSQTLENLLVDSVKTNEQDDTQLDVTIQLPKNTLDTGVSADIEVTRTSESYDLCIPIQALYEDSGSYYVYVLTETEGVLGTEQEARKVAVDVLEKNETRAALAAGSISDEQQVIVSSDRSISDGSRVRVQGTDSDA